jgi:CBS domain-containing protein
MSRARRTHDISALVVGEPGELVSIVTERDLTQAVADGRNREANSAPVTLGTVESRSPVPGSAARNPDVDDDR